MTTEHICVITGILNSVSIIALVATLFMHSRRHRSCHRHKARSPLAYLWREVAHAAAAKAAQEREAQ